MGRQSARGRGPKSEASMCELATVMLLSLRAIPGGRATRSGGLAAASTLRENDGVRPSCGPASVTGDVADLRCGFCVLPGADGVGAMVPESLLLVLGSNCLASS